MNSFEKDFKLKIEEGQNPPDPLADFERVDVEELETKDTGPYKKLLEVLENEDPFFEKLHQSENIKQQRIEKFGIAYQKVKVLRRELGEIEQALQEMKNEPDLYKDDMDEVEKELKDKQSEFENLAKFIAKEYHDILELQGFQGEAA